VIIGRYLGDACTSRSGFLGCETIIARLPRRNKALVCASRTNLEASSPELDFKVFNVHREANCCAHGLDIFRVGLNNIVLCKFYRSSCFYIGTPVNRLYRNKRLQKL
jgi:hypothetical protein